MDLIKQREALTRERAELVKQVSKLKDQLSKADEIVRSREDALINDTLSQKATDAQADALAREKRKKDLLELAIAQGNKQLTEIDRQLVENQMLQAWTVFNEGALEARSRLVSCVAKLQAVSAELHAVHDLIGGLNANSQGITMEKDDQHRLTQNIVRMLINDHKPIDVLLSQVDSAAPNIASQARTIKR